MLIIDNLVVNSEIIRIDLLKVDHSRVKELLLEAKEKLSSYASVNKTANIQSMKKVMEELAPYTNERKKFL